MHKVSIALLLFILNLTNLNAQQLAFPGAEGGGCYTVGGRGGIVYEVTNLSDSGEGSLRYGIELNVPRTIVFRVSGNIELTKDLNIRNDNLTIAGQTAPGDGICISNWSVFVSADNVIIRYIRFRPGDVSHEGVDALGGRGGNNVIIDHCTTSWSVDEIASFYGNTNFTMQWSMLYESLRISVHGKGRHGFSGIWGGNKATFHHNLIAHSDSRNPRLCGSRYSDKPEEENVDIRNNVFYNYGGNSGYAGEGGQYTFINNYYKPGPATTNEEVRNRIFEPWADDGKNKQPKGVYGKFFLSGNYVNGSESVTNDNWLGVHPKIDEFPSLTKDDFKLDSPFTVGLIQTQTAINAYNSVLANAGTSIVRDTLDKRVVEETRKGTYTHEGSNGSTNGLIDSQNDVGGWPKLKSTTAPTDSDHDGMPDDWESKKGLNPNDDADGNTVSTDGYTNLEKYLNSIEFLNPVGNYQLTKLTESSYKLQWQDNYLAEEGFIVERSYNNGEFEEIAKLPKYTDSYIDSSVLPRLVTYRVIAYNANNSTPRTSSISTSSILMSQHVDITVAQDGSGDYKTINEAIKQIPENGNERVVIFIKNGLYHERFRIIQDNLTLIGESRDSTIIQYSLLRTDVDKTDSIGVAVVNLYANDIILKNLTIINTQPKIGPHAFAIYGKGTRTIIDNCKVTSKGADTVSLWDAENGMYYHTNCHFEGAVDFVCPRGWCYIDSSSFFEVKQTAALWHAGGVNENQKFVVKNSSFDGVKGFQLGRHHYDAQFYLINCSYSENMSEKSIYRVTYPDEPERDRPYLWGERKYFFGSKKEGETFEWLSDNVQNVDTLTAKWTFDNRWDPENTTPPKCLKMDTIEGELKLEFAEEMTVRGDLKIQNIEGNTFSYKSGSGGKTIIFSRTGQSLKANSFHITDGELLGTQATADERQVQQIAVSSQTNQTTDWLIASFLNTKSSDIQISGNPQIVHAPDGEAVYFDGIDDAIFLDTMPLKSLEEFTVEMIFNPAKNAPFEQRILHIGEISEDRMLLEIRAVDDHWYFDGFAASGTNKKALIDEKLIHPLGEWYHVAFVVTPNSLTTYVNGIRELQEPYSFNPIESGQSSIGVRLNKLSWFKGSIYKIRITPKQLTNEDFMAF
ncbi:MAG: pectinesterase family protein [Chitinophagales bacterium]